MQPIKVAYHDSTIWQPDADGANSSAKPWQCGRGKSWCWCPVGRSYLRYALCLQQSNQLQTSTLASASKSASALASPVKMDPPERQKHDLYKWYRLCSQTATHWRRRRRQLISDSSNNNITNNKSTNNNNIKTALRLHEKMKGVWGVLKAVAISSMLLLPTCLHYCCSCCSGVGGAVW